MIKFLRNCRLIIILTAVPFLALNSHNVYAVTTKMWTNTDQADISKGSCKMYLYIAMESSHYHLINAE